jgi:hypothetical protein
LGKGDKKKEGEEKERGNFFDASSQRNCASRKNDDDFFFFFFGFFFCATDRDAPPRWSELVVFVVVIGIVARWGMSSESSPWKHPSSSFWCNDFY